MKYIQLLTSIILITINVACNNKESNKPVYKQYKNVKLTEDISYGIKYTLDFPDTIKINNPYKAIFKFESSYDSIVEPIKDTINFRTITLYYYNPIEIEKKDKNIFTIKDSILIPNKEFILDNIKFNKKGTFLFLAMIEDQIMHNSYNKFGKRDSIHIERKIQEIKRKIVVIE